MSTVDDHQQRSWWPLPKSPSRDPFAPEKPSRKPSTQQKPNGLSFGALASAIGLKSKKQHPSLSIQSPAFPVSSDGSNEPQSATSNRPSSKATTSSRSRTDSIEPRTPVDYQRERRRSLLTLSDADPFAVRPIITVPSPNLPSDPNRLSAFSNPSVTDLPGKRPDPPTFNRVSYASSSNSNFPPDLTPFATTPPLNINKDARRLRTKHSTGSLQVNKSDMLSRQSSLSPSVLSANNPPPSSFSDRNASTTNDGALSRPRTRPRGLTDGGVNPGQKAGFFVEERHNAVRKASKTPSLTLFPSPTHSPDPSKEFTASPRVIIRQPSVSRLFSPPTAPPTQSLPAPPAPTSQLPPEDILQGPPLARTESTSSSISFASSVSLANDIYTTQLFHQADPPDKPSPRGHFTSPEPGDPGPSRRPTTAPSSPRTLKKTISHQSLCRRPSSAPKSPPEPSPTSALPSEKSFRKQRSFHHPRLPIPPIPISLRPSESSSTNTTTFPASGDGSNATSGDKRRGSSTSSTGQTRRRLFSNSSRHKVSATQSPDNDDTRSFRSYLSEVEPAVLSFKPWLVTHLHSQSSSSSTLPASHQSPAQSSSFWDEAPSEASPGSPVRSQTDYTPQPILSPTERARLEASVALSSPSSNRNRALSTSTVTSDGDKDTEHFVTALSPRPKRPISKQSSIRASDLSLKPPSLFALPQSPEEAAWSREHSPNPVYSLPTRGRDINASVMMPFPIALRNEGDNMSVTGSQYTVRPSSSQGGLPLPPRSRQHSRAGHDLRPRTAPGLPTLGASPVIQPTRTISAKPSMEMVAERHSVLRKASFLDIDDDSDKEEEAEPEEISSSFLDLARESFDTTRSEDT